MAKSRQKSPEYMPTARVSTQYGNGRTKAVSYEPTECAKSWMTAPISEAFCAERRYSS